MAEAPKLGHHPPADFPAPLRALAAVSRALAAVEGVGIALSIALLTLLTTYRSLARNIRTYHDLKLGSWHAHIDAHPGFPAAPEWTDGVLHHFLFILGFLGAAYATYTARHIRIDAVTRIAKPFRRLVLRVVTTTAALTLVSFLLKAALDFLHDAQNEVDASMAGQIFNSARGATIILAGLGLIAFHFVVQLLLDLVWIVRRQTPPASWINEASHGGEELPAAESAGGQS